MALATRSAKYLSKLIEAVNALATENSSAMHRQGEQTLFNLAVTPSVKEANLAVARYKAFSAIARHVNEIESSVRAIEGLYAEISGTQHGKSAGRSKSVSKSNADEAKTKSPKQNGGRGGSRRGRKAAAPGTLTPNDSKLLNFLKSALKSGKPTAISGAALSTGSGIPGGSVGVSMKKLFAMGAVKSAGRGMYQIESHIDEALTSNGSTDAEVNPKGMRQRVPNRVRGNQNEVSAASRVKRAPAKVAKKLPSMTANIGKGGTASNSSLQKSKPTAPKAKSSGKKLIKTVNPSNRVEPKVSPLGEA